MRNRGTPHSTCDLSICIPRDSYRGIDVRRMALMNTYILDDNLILLWGCVRCGLDFQRLDFWCGLPCCCVGRHSGLSEMKRVKG